MDSVVDRTHGRWESILGALGFDRSFLNSRRNGPCPFCGGVDRWRFTNFKGDGDWWCNNCGHGSGLDLVMTWKKIDWTEAVKLVESVIGRARFDGRKPSFVTQEMQKADMQALWYRARMLDGTDLASRYLKKRGLRMDIWPACLRWVSGLPYWGEDGCEGMFTALLSKFVAPDAKSAILQRLFLAEPGRKAEVKKPRMTMPGPAPQGGAIRLAAPAETMGVAEGVETALSAAQMFTVPVWATLSTAGLVRFEPPEICRHLIVFADRDQNFAGLAASTALANRLRMGKHPIEVEVRVPEDGEVRPLSSLAAKCDWNDVLLAEAANGRQRGS
jgi:putative DNA primase/helicase